MSNLSDIGFPTPDEQAVNEMIMHVLEFAQPTKVVGGFYLKYSDVSGAEIYLQGNAQQELIGFNPHFAGKSRRAVNLVRKIERTSSDLDGGFYAHLILSDDEAENIPFIFDVPDFRLDSNFELPAVREVQLTAFASNDLKYFENEENYLAAQKTDLNLPAHVFAASDLFAFDENDLTIDLSPVRPVATITGVINDVTLNINQISGEKFYSFTLETSGGEVDVVADPKLFQSEPQNKGVLNGKFWVTGRLIEDSETISTE